MSEGQARAGAILLTGATGFLGKVVLALLLRELRDERVGRIHLLIRAEDQRAAEERFEQEIVASACMADRVEALRALARPVVGDCSEPRCGLTDETFDALTGEVDRVIHCAASVEFDLPLLAATRANVDGALNVLAFAQACPHITSLVSVSTAYVTPHRSSTTPIPEELAPLPLTRFDDDPELLLQAIHRGELEDNALLRECGHPNTYTLTKCLAEHLLTRRGRHIPLTIVRPSIIAASLHAPSPGWIDSPAALAAFVLMVGTGYLSVVAADPDSHLDIVPCDEVARRVLAAALASQPRDGEANIVHAVAGLENAGLIDVCQRRIIEYFRLHPVMGGPRLAYIGPNSEHGGRRFDVEHLVRHRLKGALTTRLLGLLGKHKLARRAGRLTERQERINRTFAYFTHRSFDFRSSAPLEQPLDTPYYMDLVCAGVHQHLMGEDRGAVPLAGRTHTRRGLDAVWALGGGRTQGAAARSKHGENLAIRGSGYVLSKILDRCATRIQFDRPSFEAAMLACPEDSLPVVLPTHRSYLDFLLIPYLIFSRPDLGLSMPHIAADRQFARIPVLGRIARKAHAFFLERGSGKADPALSEAVAKLVAERQNLLFFIEGERSRSRRFLEPKRGLLRSLQSTGVPMIALPIAIDFDRVPEELTFERELAGAPSPGIRLRLLAGWLVRLMRGKIELGVIQIRCGEPIPFDDETDRHALSHAIVRSMATASSVSSYHLRCFLAAAERPELDVDFLRAAIEARGGRVIDSPLEAPAKLPARSELALREQWMHHFFPEARVLYGEDPAVARYLRLREPLCPESARDARDLDDPRIKILLEPLLEPIRTQHRQVAELLASGKVSPDADAAAVTRAGQDLYRPYVADALAGISDPTSGGDATAVAETSPG